MALKVRCPSCRQVLSAPDAAVGKAVKCPGCGSKVRVPAGKGAKEGAKRAGASGADGPVEDLGALDLRLVEDVRGRVCPKCGRDLSFLDEEETECPDCGYDATLGGLGEKAARKLRRGPDPAEFYGVAWADSWNFLWRHKKLAFKTGLFWTIAGVLCLSFLNMAAWCETLPPRVVWGAIGCIFGLGLPGLYWSLNSQIIRETIARRKNPEIRFDFVQNMSMGLKSIAWPFVLLMPLTFPFIALAAVLLLASLDMSVAGMIYSFRNNTEWGLPPFVLPPEIALLPLAIVAPIVYLLTRPVFPLAQVHMVAKYTSKAWLPVDMAVTLFRNFGAALYWCVMWLAAFLPVLLVVGIAGAVIGPRLSGIMVGLVGRLAVWLTLTCGYPATLDPAGGTAPFTVYVTAQTQGGMFYIMLGFSWFVVFAAFVAPVALLAAFPAVFAMRANGLLGYYFQKPLGMVNDRPPNLPAGFWVRYLALLVDLFIVGVALILTRLLGYFLVFAGTILGAEPSDLMSLVMIWAYSGFVLLFTFIYFAKQECDHAQGTLGKYGIGLVVTDANGNRISQGMAVGRYFARILSAIPLGAGFLMAAFTERKQTLHDRLTKTYVVWRGDEPTAR